MKRIEVVAAVIRRDGKYFATQRGYGEIIGNFPAGRWSRGRAVSRR